MAFALVSGYNPIFSCHRANRGVFQQPVKGQQLLGGEPSSGTGRLLQQYFGADAETIGVSMQLGSTEAVKHAVQAGLGVSLVMAASVSHEAQSGLLHAIPIAGEPLQKVLYVIRRDGGMLRDGPAVQFADFLLKQQ